MNDVFAAGTPSHDSAAAEAAKIVHSIFRDYPGALAVRLWNNATIRVGKGNRGKPEFTLVFKAPVAFQELAWRQCPLRLAHAYFAGMVDVEDDLYRALELRNFLGNQRLKLADKAAILARLLALRSTIEHAPAPKEQPAVRQSPLSRLFRANSKIDNQLAIAFHYDVPSAFYRTFLDREMVYSCAYFEDPADSLDQAQANKLDHICKKLRLKPGEKMLDIGCGWGALAIWAARHYGVHATGITLSKQQFEFARRRVKDEGLEDRVVIELRDYRDLPAAVLFDKVASIGMFEHVGLQNLPTYFNCVHRVLKPGGLFLNHGITHDEEGWNRTLYTEFINRYVFPDGELDTVSNVQRQMERAQFEIWDVEGLRPHYARTLRCWVQRLEAARDEALRYVDEATYRIWRLYMAGCALHFEQGDTGIYQILASRRAAGVAPLPLTRRDLYA